MESTAMDMKDMKRTVDALIGLLQEWARWQEGYRPRLGYPSRSAFAITGDKNDFDGLCEAADQETYRAIDASVQDLPPVQQAAVLKRYGLAAVFQFRPGVYEQALCDAHEALLPALRRKGVMVGA